MFNWLKFFQGFNIFNGEKLGKIIFYAVLIATGLLLYHNAFTPKTIYTAPVTQIAVLETKQVVKFKIPYLFELRIIPYGKN